MQIFTPDGVATEARLSLSNGTTVGPWPSDEVLLSWARERLGMD
jgi:hypothetical protein